MASVGTAYVDIQGDFSSVSRQAQAFFAGPKWKVATAGAVGLGAGVAAIGALSVKAAAQFESSFAEVKKTVDTNKKGFAEIERGIRNLAKTIPIGVNELNDLAGQAGALGIKAKDIVEFTEVAAKLGTTTDLASSDAANALARLSNIMGTSSKDFDRLGSTLVELGNKGASTEGEITAMALRIAGAGKQVGLSEAQVLSFSSALSSVGVQAEAGGSAISRAFVTMSEAVDKGKGAVDAFAKVAGTSSGSFSRLFNRDAGAAMVQFLEGLEGIRQRGGSVFAVLEKLGLSEIRVRDALLRASGAGKLFSEQLKIGSKEWERNTALNEEANKRFKTTEAQWTIFKNRINDVAITIGQELLPVVNRFLQWLNSLNFNKAIQGLKDFWKSAGVLRDVIGAVVGFVKDRLTGMFDVVKGTVKLIAAVLTGRFGDAWDAIKDIFKAGVKLALAPIKAAVGLAKDIAGRIGDGLEDVFGGAWDRIKDIFRGGVNAVIDFVNLIIKAINLIPGVDIGLVGKIGGGGQESGAGESVNANLNPQNRFSGGKITAPMAIVGEEAPTHPEYVIATNPRYRERNKRLFAQAGQDLGIPGFAKGGKLHGIDALDAIGGSAGALINKLPNPNVLPDWTGGLGGYLIDKASAFIRDKVKNIVENAADAVTGGMTSTLDRNSDPAAMLADASRLAAKHGLAVTGDTDRYGAASYHNPNFDPPHVARDFSNGVDTPQMAAFAKSVIKSYGVGRILELFYDPTGVYIDNYAHQPGVIGGHSDHVHLAFRKGGILGRDGEPIEFFRDGGKRGKGGGTGLGLGNLSSFNINQLTTLAAKHGMRNPALMAAIAMAESSGNPDAVGDGGWSHGLWQVYTKVWNQFAASRLHDPNYNAKAAKHILDVQGPSAWTMYNNGTYRKYLGGQVLQGPSNDSGGSGGKGGKGGKDKPDKPPPTVADIPGVTSGFGGEAIKALERAIRARAGFIEEAQTIAAAPMSPEGEELSPAERAKELGLWKGQESDQLQLFRRLNRTLKNLPKNSSGRKAARRIRERLLSLVGASGQTGELLDTRTAIFQLEHPEADASEVPDNTAERLALQEEINLQILRENAILRAQTPVFNSLFRQAPFGGVFHEGGVVPGPPGQERTIIAQGGEVVSPGGPVEVTLVVNDGAVNADAIDVRINDRLANIARQSSPRGGVIGRKASYG